MGPGCSAEILAIRLGYRPGWAAGNTFASITQVRATQRGQESRRRERGRARPAWDPTNQVTLQERRTTRSGPGPAHVPSRGFPRFSSRGHGSCRRRLSPTPRRRLLLPASRPHSSAHPAQVSGTPGGVVLCKPSSNLRPGENSAQQFQGPRSSRRREGRSGTGGPHSILGNVVPRYLQSFWEMSFWR